MGKIDLRWYQGKNIKVSENAHHPTVYVKWDPTSYIAGYEEGGITKQVLLLSKWNKDGKDGAGRMDVDIELESDEDLSDKEEKEEQEDKVSEGEGESDVEVEQDDNE